MSHGAVMTSVMKQFGRPSGLVGDVAGWVMAHRPSNRERNWRTLELLDIRPQHRVLEIGFGPGVALAWAAERARHGHVAGIDHSERMLRMAARRNAAAIAAGRVELYLASVETMPVFVQRFDKAYAVNVHQFWSDAEAMLACIAAVLRPGATLALTVQPRQPGATAEDTRRAEKRLVQSLEAGGLREIRSEVFDLRPVPAVCVLGRTPADGGRR